MHKAILHSVIIYTLAHCPFCTKAKDLLTEKKIKFQEIEVENFTPAERAELKAKSGGKSTVPQIFIDNKYIGGCDDLYKLEEKGKLDELLEI